MTPYRCSKTKGKSLCPNACGTTATWCSRDAKGQVEYGVDENGETIYKGCPFVARQPDKIASRCSKGLRKGDEEWQVIEETRMRVATVDGLVTLFYDGSKTIYNVELEDEWYDEKQNHANHDDWEEWNLSDECKRYLRERCSWQQVIIEEGVTEIPYSTFYKCKNIKRVIMADTVIRIKIWAFRGCRNLTYIKWSINIEVIGNGAFADCGLVSVFIPQRCTTIEARAFGNNDDLEIFHVHSNVQLGDRVLSNTKLLRDSRFELDKRGNYDLQTHEVHNWLKNMNNDEKYSLHRACTSFQPLKEVIYTIILEKGIGAFNIKNEAGITPSRYLKENPYADIKETDIIRNYFMKMMGEYE